MPKVIIDTDTGVDDGLAVIYGLLSAELDVLALTTVFGNVDVEKITRNTAAIAERLGSSAPIAKGAARGMAGGEPTFNPEVHGEDGFGNANLPEPTYAALVDTSAAQLIVDLAAEHPGEITWIGLGPMTNLAMALLLDPELPDRLTRIVWMGGAVASPGNVTAVAEADALHDPEALAFVYDQSWDVLQVGLDVTDDTVFTEAHLDAVRASTSPAAQLVAAGAPDYMKFYQPVVGQFGCAMHSPLTVAVVAHPELVTAEETFIVHVELAGTHTRGMTVADRRAVSRRSPGPQVRVVLDVDRETFLTRFVERVVA